MQVRARRGCGGWHGAGHERGDAGAELRVGGEHSKPIVDDAYLMTVTIYNDVNAYMAGRVADPLAHVWSTGPLPAGLRGSRIPRAL